MDGPRGYYAKENKSERERQIPHDFTYMWNLKNNMKDQTKQKQTHRYREQTDGCQLEEGFRGWVRKVKGVRNTNWQLENSHGHVNTALGIFSIIL